MIGRGRNVRRYRELVDKLYLDPDSLSNEELDEIGKLSQAIDKENEKFYSEIIKKLKARVVEDNVYVATLYRAGLSHKLRKNMRHRGEMP